MNDRREESQKREELRKEEELRKRADSRKMKVAFLCTRNSCRSQMAEALGKLLVSDVFESCSAGTEIKDEINPDAVRTVKRL